MKIIPAILAYNIADYRTKLKLALTMTSTVQIDIIDQSFADTPTLRLKDLDISEEVRPIFHLMTASPADDITACLQHKPERIIVHAESNIDLSRISSLVPRHQFGIAINPNTPTSKIKDCISQVSEILVMTVTPGASGRPFQPAALDKIKKIKSMSADMTVSVDGGIDHQTISAVRDAGADIAYIASGIFKQTDPIAAYHQLQEPV